MISDFGELLNRAKAVRRPTVAVVAPHDDHSLETVKEALEFGLAELVLFGDRERLAGSLASHEIEQDRVAIVDVPDLPSAAREASAYVSRGEAQLLMKGAISTPMLLKAALKSEKEGGLGTGRLCSHLVVCQIPGFNRLIIVTDGGLNISPDLKAKLAIVKNAVGVAHALGIERPRVAALAALEQVNPAMPSTVDAASLSKMAERGLAGNAVVDGPLALDNAISPEALAAKGIESPVEGRADILLVPYIEVGNVLGKSLVYFAHSLNAGVIVGARAPIAMVSRASSSEAKLASLALAIVVHNTQVGGGYDSAR